MIQLKQQVPLKIDVLSKDNICMRLFLWTLFYLMLQIFMIGDKKKLVHQLFFPLICNETILNENITEQNCVTYGIFNSQIQDMQIEGNFTILTEDIYKLNKSKLPNNLEIHNIQTDLLIKANDTFDDIANNRTLSSYIYTKVNEDFRIDLDCELKDDHYTCLSNIFQFKTSNQQYLLAEISIIKPTQYKSLKISYLTAYYESRQYYQYMLVFQFLFFIIISYSIYYGYNILSEYPKESWPDILKWIPYLLGMMVIYNMPVQLLRQDHTYFVQFYFNFSELIVQTSLFYFWLKIFEFQKLSNMTLEQIIIKNRYLKITNTLKLIIVMLYTFPQALMNFYILYMKSFKDQFDPLKQVKYYQQYQQLIVGSLVLYSLIFIYQLQKQFNYKQENADNALSQEKKKYEIFDETAQMSKQPQPMKSYKLLHILSTICLSVLLYNQYIRYYEPKNFSAHNTLNEWGLINIYVCIIVQLYIPYHIYSNTYVNDKDEDNTIKNEAI